jgi:hypothetical protein
MPCGLIYADDTDIPVFNIGPKRVITIYEIKKDQLKKEAPVDGKKVRDSAGEDTDDKENDSWDDEEDMGC